MSAIPPEELRRLLAGDILPDEAKRMVRSSLRDRRTTLHAALKDTAPPLVRDAFVDGLKPEPCTVVSGYWPIGAEIDVMPLMAWLAANDCVTTLPVVVAPSQPLVFRAWEPGAALVDGPMGTRHPPDDVMPFFPDIMLIPLLAFDAAGFRLGYGGGYFDRTLDALRAKRRVVAVGVAYAGQKVECLPRESFDQPMDWILTEQGLVKAVP